MILLDTHVLVWLVVDPARLSRRAASAIRRSRVSDGLGVSDISLWELANLLARGRVRSLRTVEDSLCRFVEFSGVVVKPITPEIAAIATQLPPDYPRDPADRLIGATARAEGIPLVTKDESIRCCTLLETIW